MTRIAVVAPSCPLKREAAERVEAIVAERGDCELAIHPQCFLSAGHFAGTDDERLAAIGRIAARDDVDVAIALRGGYGTTRLLERLDYDALARAGKRWLGHSDFTAFQCAALARAGMVTYAGPTFAFDFGAEAPSAFTLDHCFGLLGGNAYEVACALDGQSRLLESWPVGAHHVAGRGARRIQQLAQPLGLHADVLNAGQRLGGHQARRQQRTSNRRGAAARSAVEPEQLPHRPAQAVGQGQGAQEHIVRASVEHHDVIARG